jgi:hypothetical protein
MAGFRETEGETTVSKGGVAVTTVFDSYFRYDVEIQRFGPYIGVSGPDDQGLFFSQVSAWLSEAQAGVLFEFIGPDGNSADETLDGAEAQGETTLTVSNNAPFLVEDTIYIQDANDPTQFEMARIESKAAPASPGDITLWDGLKANYDAGSIVRSKDYFPKCLLLKHKFRERPAGKGNQIWDLVFSFRTVT